MLSFTDYLQYDHHDVMCDVSGTPSVRNQLKHCDPASQANQTSMTRTSQDKCRRKLRENWQAWSFEKSAFLHRRALDLSC
jgi:hypothetical protein